MPAHGIAITPPGRSGKLEPVYGRRGIVREGLLVCGILSSLLYVAMNVFVPMLWEGYSVASQTVSELSAIDAPTRPLWVPLGLTYTLLMAAFGWGIWMSARGNRSLRVVGAVLLVYGIFGLGPPMHLRPVLAAGGGTLSDTLHIARAIGPDLWSAAIGHSGQDGSRALPAFSSSSHPPG